MAVLVLVLAGGVWLGGHPAHLPGSCATPFVEDHKTRVVDEALERIAHDYYRPIPGRDQLSDSLDRPGRGRPA